MKLIVGLGNPGRLYQASRHTIGFSVIKTLAKQYKITLRKRVGACYASGKGKIGRHTVLLAMPLTFMNVSGVAVRSLLEEHRISREELLVVCDDLDLEFGRMKIRPRGSSGGHRGLASIGESLRGEDFCRLRIGIGRPERNTDPADYVLASFTRQERESLTAVIDRAAACCSTWAAEGITKSMNIFNQRST